MDRVDIKLGFDCNNACEFCVQGNKRSHCASRPPGQVHRDLQQGHARGAREVVFTGGEPTLQHALISSIRVARRLGYESVQLQTNGRSLSYPTYCETLVAAGVTEFSPAIHGATAETHDRLTRAPGSFEQTLAGIRNLSALGQRVITNTVVTSLNYRELPQLARLLVQLGVAQYQFAYVHIVGTAATNAAWLAPRKTEVLPFVLDGLNIGRDANVRCLTEAIPFCFMRGYEDCVAERIIPQSMIFDANKTIDDYTEYRRSKGKVKREACRRCRWDVLCEGPWREYPERFGWEEMVPVV